MNLLTRTWQGRDRKIGFGPGSSRCTGARIALENVDLFREWYVHVKNPAKESYTLGPGWYADGLLPCLRWSGNLYPHTYVMPFDIPDPLNNVAAEQKSQALWVDASTAMG